LTASSLIKIKGKLDRLYRRFHHRRYVHPDPLVFLYRYPNLEDRELVGIIAASLAYGRVAQIIKSIQTVVAILDPSPCRNLRRTPTSLLRRRLGGFVHRFATDSHMVGLLSGARGILQRYGSLKNGFLDGWDDGDPTVQPALSAFVDLLKSAGAYKAGHLLPDPKKGSASKRLHLFLRWMVRQDRIDPGGWYQVPASKLLIPLDVHMHRVSVGLGLTQRRQADLKTVMEVTAGFRAMVPKDPVRYDFVLSRLGIRADMNMEAFLANGDR
jgi:uncharacterized protein (TIGR02757 family)